ncbi:glycerol acyltransferase [Bacteroidia bacterium]|nr:glycerol acyltransferase [Bacteroidia bacterium]
MSDNNVFQLNVKEILRTKAPKLYKKIPGFVITGLAKLVCQEKLNEIIRKNAGVTGVDFMQNLVQDFHLTLHLKGTENLPEVDKPCIFASNHPLGGLDGICLSAILGKHYNKKVRYLVNDILYFIRPLQDIFVPVNKHGAQAKSAVEAMNEAFLSDNQIITFPAGLCSRKTNGVIHDPEWKKMFITKAVEYQRDIVPVYFEARNSNLFYTIANGRKKLHIGFNLEMLLLPSEMFKAAGSTFTVYFGKPVPWQTFDASKTPQQWAKEMENRTYDTKNNTKK